MKLWDIKVRATARILEKGTQNNLIQRAKETRVTIGKGQSWQDHNLTWVAVKDIHYNTCLEEILANIGENGERHIMWDFTQERKQLYTMHTRHLGNKNTL